ncbi:MAG: DUF2807 domain-containing protein [Bacteroidales bacterium]|nr:DUF2807 domain-containing protein [Bacteroidales bacterium]
MNNTIKHIAATSVLAVLTIALNSCYIRISDEAKQDIKDSFKYEKLMSEVVYSQNDSLVYTPGEFHTLEASSWIDIIFEQREGEPEVVVKGSTRVRDSIKVENVDGTLKIYYAPRGGLLYTKDEYVKVFAPGLDRIVKGGSGDLSVKGTLMGGSFVISSSGSGDLYIEGCEIKGPVTIDKTGSGDIEARVKCESLLVGASGSGDVILSGEATEASIRKSGSGDLEARKLTTKKIDVSKSGSGDVIYNEDGVVKTD